MANDDFFLSKNVKVIRAMKGKEFRGLLNIYIILK